MIYPLAIGAACVVTSIIGTFFVTLGANNSIMGALYKGFIATAVLSLIVLYPVTWLVFGVDVPSRSAAHRPSAPSTSTCAASPAWSSPA